MNNKIFIYTETQHSRLSFVIGFIRQFCFDYDWVLSNSLTEYQSHKGISINYSGQPIKEDELFIYYSGWLVAKHNSYLDIPIRNSEASFQIFPNVEDDEFDIFAAVFYVLARVEEYLPFEQDKHGRFSSTQSILYKNKALAIPIVDFWVIQFIHLLESKYKVKLTIEKIKPLWSLGIDVDQFYKYKYKSVFKQTGGFIKSILNCEFNECIQRIRILLFNRRDPYDSFDHIQRLKIDKDQLLFFILSGGHSAFDKNHSLHLKQIQTILKKISAFSKIALHPSYTSATVFSELAIEKKNLENALSSSIDISRQHYLKIRFPESYRLLIVNGIKKDYSLGYADNPGFRAGTCRNFFWYDLEQEAITDLMLIPFIAMDRTFLDYLKLNPESSKEAIIKLFEICVKAGGHFHMIWHNSSYDFYGEWKKWEGVLETLVQYFKDHESKMNS